MHTIERKNNFNSFKDHGDLVLAQIIKLMAFIVISERQNFIASA